MGSNDLLRTWKKRDLIEQARKIGAQYRYHWSKAQLIASIIKTNPGEGNLWGSDEKFPHVDWQSQVADNDTRLGYWDWVKTKRERDGCESRLQ